MVLTNGRENPNDNLGSSGENYEDLKQKIRNFGPMREVVQNEELVMSIIAYNGDRHLFAAFIELINEALEKKEIWNYDLTVFNSGKVADAIVNMEETARIYGCREKYPFETGDKLNYLSLLKDNFSFAASFTHPAILSAIKEHGNKELRYWMQTSDVPSEGMAALVSELISIGAIREAAEYLNNVSYYARKYVASNQVKRKTI